MGNGAYRAAYQQSLSDPDAFWGEAAKAIDWITPPHRVLDGDRPPAPRPHPWGDSEAARRGRPAPEGRAAPTAQTGVDAGPRRR